MTISSFLWLTVLTSPLIGIVLSVYLCFYQEKLSRIISMTVSLLVSLSISLIGILLLEIYEDSSAINRWMKQPGGLLDSISDAGPILSDWYWFLLILIPLVVIPVFLTTTGKRESLTRFYSTIVAIALAFLVSALLILFARANTEPELIDQWLSNPLRILDPILEAGEIFLNASFGFDKFGLLLDGKSANDADFYREFGRTLGLATPLIFSALVFAVSAKAGLFNIGGEGAFIVGGFVGAVIGVWLPDMLPISLSTDTLYIIHLPLVFLCAAFVGALFGAIPGVLRAYLGAHEVITTIMLNPIAYLLVFMMVRDYYTVADLRTETPPVLKTTKLPHLLPGPLGAEYFIAIFIAIGLYFFLFRTTYGLEMRAVGENPSAAEYAGIPVKKRQVQAMSLGGAIGAIGGAGMSIGYYHYFHPSHPGGIGFDGIAVSVLGANSPLALIPVAILFGAIKNGGSSLSTTMGIPKDIVATMRGLVILFAAAPLVFSFLFRKIGKNKENNEVESTYEIESRSKSQEPRSSINQEVLP